MKADTTEQPATAEQRRPGAPDGDRRYHHPVAAACALGFVGALLTGSAAAALGPLALLALWRVLRRSTLERLLVFTVAATIGLDHPSEIPYMHKWHSPLEPFGRIWFESVRRTVAGVPIPFSPAVLVIGWILLRAMSSRRIDDDATARRLLRLCALGAAALGVADLYGLSRGGDLQQTLYQVLPLLTTLAIAASACLLASPKLVLDLERVLLIAAAFRAVIALYVYLTVVRPAGESYLYVTTHSDSVLWVVALAVLVGRMVSFAGLGRQQGRLALVALLLAAITVNNRRLAWVELGVVLIYVFWALPARLRRQRRRLVLFGLPMLAVYVGVGLSAGPSPLFMPVQALTSVNNDQDSSTMSREIENHNLIVTIRQGGPLGLGFGHEYTEQVKGPDISKAFVQYRYLPHNSVLGLVAFGGIVGFICYWLPFVAGMGAAVRLRRAPSPPLQAAGVWLAAGLIAFGLMAWGDIGLQSAVNGLLGGLGAGLASGLARRATTNPPRPDDVTAGTTHVLVVAP